MNREERIRLVEALLREAPSVEAAAFVAPNATVVGSVTLGQDSSVWFGSVIRGDVVPVRIGARTNIQDLSLIHGSSGGPDVVIGEDVTVGHRAILHGCSVGNGCLIGMGAIVLDEVVVGEHSLVAAGALVTPRTVIPPRSFVVGSPARIKREVSDNEMRDFLASAHHYVALSRLYSSGTR
jgi:carbonic anhydrase/acetyltransferase-like protein (isoleucine patch superfamily)